MGAVAFLPPVKPLICCSCLQTRMVDLGCEGMFIIWIRMDIDLDTRSAGRISHPLYATSNENHTQICNFSRKGQSCKASENWSLDFGTATWLWSHDCHCLPRSQGQRNPWINDLNKWKQMNTKYDHYTSIHAPSLLSKGSLPEMNQYDVLSTAGMLWGFSAFGNALGTQGSKVPTASSASFKITEVRWNFQFHRFFQRLFLNFLETFLRKCLTSHCPTGAAQAPQACIPQAAPRCACTSSGSGSWTVAIPMQCQRSSRSRFSSNPATKRLKVLQLAKTKIVQKGFIPLSRGVPWAFSWSHRTWQPLSHESQRTLVLVLAFRPFFLQTRPTWHMWSPGAWQLPRTWIFWRSSDEV